MGTGQPTTQQAIRKPQNQDKDPNAKRAYSAQKEGQPLGKEEKTIQVDT